MDTHTKKSSPRDVFLHLLAVIALYVSAGSFINLVFKLINYSFPDELDYVFNLGNSIRYAIASLIILYPVFLWVSRRLEQDTESDPAKADIRIRRWLLNFTLFAAAALLIGDLVAVVFSFLNGELTVRFALKALTIFVVAGAVFGYYRWSLRKKPGEFPPRARFFVWGVSAVVLLGIIGGFAVAGSPFRARLERLDSERISDLQVIQYQIVYFWQQKDRLPDSLSELRDSISGFVPPTDPVTGEPYGYERAGALSFELCAVFDLSSGGELNGRGVPFPEGPFGFANESWAHGEGEACFDRVIDPELYAKPSVRF